MFDIFEEISTLGYNKYNKTTTIFWVCFHFEGIKDYIYGNWRYKVLKSA